MADASLRSPVPFVQFAFEPGSQVNIDGLRGYAGLAKEGCERNLIRISGHVLLNQIREPLLRGGIMLCGS